MADNVSITAGSGTAIAADDISSVWYQRMKLSLGADGTAVDAVAGAGAVGTGVQRVTLASDDPAVVDLAALEVLATAGNVSTAAIDTKTPALGQALAAASVPVVISSDQSAVPVLHAPRASRARQVTTITDTSETTIVSAGATGVFRDVFLLLVSNTSATATNVTIRDATAGTTVFVLAVPAGQTVGYSLSACDAIKQSTAANNWTAQLSAGVTSIVITAAYVEN
jgi:hypothetical protein